MHKSNVKKIEKELTKDDLNIFDLPKNEDSNSEVERSSRSISNHKKNELKTHLTDILDSSTVTPSKTKISVAELKNSASFEQKIEKKIEDSIALKLTKKIEDKITSKLLSSSAESDTRNERTSKNNELLDKKDKTSNSSTDDQQSAQTLD